ncbi:MAG TPA: PH domain-containing protein [Bryobacteraceae bacterium]|jgi:hypothetical protein|nr:PH domain-containing protein [Bryobacteraceae bacterium]
MTQVFPLAPADSWAGWLLFFVIIVPVSAICAYLAMAPRLTRLEVSPGLLRIRGDLFYGRTIAIQDLRLEQAHRVDLGSSPDYRLTLRTNGTGAPGYKAGWFRTAAGHKALAFVRNSKDVVVIPHRKDYVLILNPADPAGFLDALRQASVSR